MKIDAKNRVLSTVDKPTQSSLKYLWGTCCWSGRFTQLMSDFLARHDNGGKETVLGDVFNAALASGMSVRGIPTPGGRYIDIGTSDELNAALKEFHAS